jgi:hypothetical protein
MADFSESPPEPRSPADFPQQSPGSLYWLKTTDPEARTADFGSEIDARVLSPDGERFRPLRERLEARGAEVRGVKYWLEHELVTDIAVDGGAGGLTVRTEAAYPTRGGREQTTRREDPPAAVARDASEAL